MGTQIDTGEMQRYRRFWRRKIAEHEASIAHRREEGRALAAECATLLATKYGVRKVVLIGSLTLFGPVHEHPDIDLVVLGLHGPDYLSALNVLHNSLPSGWDVDLIPWEDALASMQEAVEEGEVLYEKPLQDSGRGDTP